MGLAYFFFPLTNTKYLHLENKNGLSWHAGIQLEGTTLQNLFLADIVSMVDQFPLLYYLNYCRQQERLYTYYILENWHLTRTEFDSYCKWVASQRLKTLALNQYKLVDNNAQWELIFDHVQLDLQYRHVTDGLVFATGYRHELPHIVAGIHERICWDDQGRYAPSNDWAVDHEHTEMFVQNVDLHSHGLTGPDLGLTCYRNSRLLHKLTGIDFYSCEERTVLQDFVPRASSRFETLESRSAV